MTTRRFGVIVGSGLDKKKNPFGTEDVVHHQIQTRIWPNPVVDLYEIPLGENTSLVFTARHLEGHRLLPSEVNYRGIMFAMKKLGVEVVVGVSAVGSRREDIKPGTLAAVHQYIDRTKLREQTFFGDGIVGHVSFGRPVCDRVEHDLLFTGHELGIPIESGRTLMVMEGPAFSTEAEIKADLNQAALIGMTSMPEAKLAREAELCYCTLACVTDYDSGIIPGRPSVTAEEVSQVFKTLKKSATQVVREAAKRFFARNDGPCGCQPALDTAIMTDPNSIPGPKITRLGPILKRWADINLKK